MNFAIIEQSFRMNPLFYLNILRFFFFHVESQDNNIFFFGFTDQAGRNRRAFVNVLTTISRSRRFATRAVSELQLTQTVFRALFGQRADARVASIPRNTETDIDGIIATVMIALFHREIPASTTNFAFFSSILLQD